MNKVYIVQAQPGKNLVPAIQYGELVELLPPNEQVVCSTDRAIKIIGDKLSTFDDKDYLLLIGDPIAILIAGVMAAKTNNGFVNTLKWDRQREEYYSVKLDFNKYEINFNRKVSYERK
jgi:hypothetical protein